ncbi:MAG: asparagine synthase-related protein [Nitrospirota bacterium]
MFGAASNEKLDVDYVKGIVSSQRTGRDPGSSVSCNGWAAVCGSNIFEDDYFCVLSDSEIYNSQKLSRLLGAELQNDSHLIGLLYRRYDLLMLDKLRGQFSLCILDKKRQKLIIATDRFGIKPVVYYSCNDTFIFGPRIKTIQSLSQSAINEIDYEAVADYINFSAIPTPKTIFKGIRKLPPGHFLTVERTDIRPRITQYYDIEYLKEIKDEKYFINNLPDLVEKSARNILEYESFMGRRVGAFLSGGTDSSTLTGMISKIAGSVKTFSIGFDEQGYNELYYARTAAKHFNAEHCEYMVTPEDVLKTIDVLPDAYDEPFGNSSAVPTYFCARMAREHGVDTLLAGDGGDEIFGGNERYASDRIFSRYHTIPAVIRRRIIEPVLSAGPASIGIIGKGKKYVCRANIPQPDRFYSYNPVAAFGKEKIFSSDLLKTLNGYDTVAWARDLYGAAHADNELNRLLYIDMKFTITDNDIRKVSMMSEMAGIRVAYPFLDHQLVNFAATIPSSLKVKGTRLRHIFKKAFNDFLPAEVIKKRKHGFGLPIGIWLRTKKKISVFAKECLLSSDCAIKPYFRKNFIENMFSMHDVTKAVFYGDVIWSLLIFELWHKRWKQK